MSRDESAPPGSRRNASPEFHSRNDDLRADWGRTREEYVALHEQLGEALAKGHDEDLRLWDRKWSELCNLMDDRDYWRQRYVRYHNRYLEMEKRMLSYREEYKYAAHDLRVVREMAHRLELDLGRYQIAEAERAHQEAVDAAQRELIDYGGSFLKAIARSEHDIAEGERLLAEEARLEAARNLPENDMAVEYAPLLIHRAYRSPFPVAARSLDGCTWQG